MDKLLSRSVAHLARAIESGEISSREIVSAFLDRIETVNPKLNAVALRDREAVLRDAEDADRALAHGMIKGPLHGVPMTIKDNLDTAGVVSTGGTKGRESFVPEKDATVVKRLRDAGAILLGKTITPELTMAYETANLVHGVTNNPHDLSLTPGGSSGGAAAIISAGGSPFDIGSDTGGSIRIPSHFCGIVGLKPTAGRVPKTGHILPIGSVVDAMTQLGPMARYVDDLHLLLGIIQGSDEQDSTALRNPPLIDDYSPGEVKGFRIAYLNDDTFLKTSADVADAVSRAARLFEKAGAEVELIQPNYLREAFELTLALWTADGGAGFDDVLRSCGTTELHPFMQNVMAVSRSGEKTVADFSRLLVRWETFRRSMLQRLKSYDIILSPVYPGPAFSHGKSFDPDYFPGFSYTMVHNLTGWPAAVVRAGATNSGLPLGVQLAGKPWTEARLLSAATVLEGDYPIHRA